MKLKYIFAAIISLAFVAVGCTKEEATSLSNLKVSQTYLSIPEAGGDATVTIDATEDWEFVKAFQSGAKDDNGKAITDLCFPTWLTASTEKGAAGTTELKFTAAETSGGREAELTISVGAYKQTILVRQGEMTVTSATCKEIIAGADGKSYRVTGTCTSIDNTTYGNWYLNDGTGEIVIYGTLDAKGAEKNFASLGIEAGDVVTVEGPKTTYGTTIELVNVTVLKITKSLVKVTSEDPKLPKEGGEFKVVVSHKCAAVLPVIPEGSSWITYKSAEYATGVPTKLDPNPANTTTFTFVAAANEAGAREGSLEFVPVGSKEGAKFTVSEEGAIIAAKAAEIAAAEDGTTVYRIKAIVSKVDDAAAGKFYLSDASGSIYVYKCTNSGDKSLNVGDIVTLTGNKSSYKGTAQIINPVIEEVQDVQPITAAEFAALADDTTKSKYYLLSGEIVTATGDGTKNDLTTYGNFSLKDDSGEIYVYGVSTGYNGETKKFGTLGLALGDKLTILAYKTSYKGLNQAGGAMYLSSEKKAAE